MSALDLSDRWRRSQYGHRDDDMCAAQTRAIVILDELGQEDARPAWLLEITDPRYRAGRITITTTGLRPEQLGDRYGSGAVRRLVAPRGAVISDWGDGG